MSTNAAEKQENLDLFYKQSLIELEQKIKDLDILEAFNILA